MNDTYGARGQLVVRYDVDRTSNPDQILVDEGYFVHFYAPPNLPTLNKHVIFVLDLSGSMFGTKLIQLKDAMVEILSDLRKNDYFSIVLFSNKAHVWSLDSSNETSTMLDEDAANQTLTFQNHVIRVNEDTIAKAKKAIKQMQDQGGTNIIDGLRKAIEMAKVGRETFANKVEIPEPIIIFLTDGEPNVEMSDPEEIIKEVKKLNENKYQIFSLAFGNGADYNFLRKLSLDNAAFARNIYEASDAALQLRNFYKQVSSPLLANVTFNYLPGQVDFNSTTKRYLGICCPDDIKPVSNVSRISTLGNLENDMLIGTTDYFMPPDAPVVLNAVPPASQGPVAPEQAKSDPKIAESKSAVETTPADSSTTETKAVEASKYSFVTPLTSLVVVKPNETSNAVETQKDTPEEPGHSYTSRSSGNMPVRKQFRKQLGHHAVKRSGRICIRKQGRFQAKEEGFSHVHHSVIKGK
ncbi:inter-alpha-trypsin inhibitor heavy chain H3-like [Diaphorina citri]|uniref:Inter-alpha-trypsin inhibitor heavy chain H3-like n=1 Tax=Diaphorina citri TaxID=121845 RepID=A0A1S4EAT4_DIACI|nr:inter-alpha-trypsin inhibitor heavy chain H3-like [Diaphorina citri]